MKRAVVASRVIGLTGQIFSSLYSHTEIDNRFRLCGYSDEPPNGNKIQKVAEWLVLANTSETEPVARFYELIEHFMEMNDPERMLTIDGRNISVFDAQAKLKASMELGGLLWAARAPMQDTVPNQGAPTSTINLQISKGLTDLNKKFFGGDSMRNKPSVFLVHGHDDKLTHEVARLVERLGMECVVLRELADNGKTVIEKFEQSSDVAYAIVLMTADDIGGPKLGGVGNNLAPRARQNVILELGYFVGKLGRSKVTILIDEGVEQPSDILGILYTKVDSSSGWKLKLAQEMRAAGLSVDLNRL